MPSLCPNRCSGQASKTAKRRAAGACLTGAAGSDDPVSIGWMPTGDSTVPTRATAIFCSNAAGDRYPSAECRRYGLYQPSMIAAQLERNWEAALQRVAACEARLTAQDWPDPKPERTALGGFSGDLDAAWNAPGVTTRTRQRLGARPDHGHHR